MHADKPNDAEMEKVCYAEAHKLEIRHKAWVMFFEEELLEEPKEVDVILHWTNLVVSLSVGSWNALEQPSRI